jgi:uncharacterized Zn finger protein (UPF0148 family)
MEKEKLCPKCKSDYLKPTNDPGKIICPFCGTSQLHLTLKDTLKILKGGYYNLESLSS